MTHLIYLRLQPGRVVLASLNFRLKIVVTFGIWRADGREGPNGGCSRAQASDKERAPRCPGGADGSSGCCGQHSFNQLREGSEWIPVCPRDKRAWRSGWRRIFSFDASSSTRGLIHRWKTEPHKRLPRLAIAQVAWQTTSCLVVQGCIRPVDRRIFSPH